jgi:hypothetical protein
MKTKIAVILIMLGIISVMARLPASFLGWDQLKSNSPEIIIADPKEPTPSTTKILFDDGPNFDFGISVLSVLKGTNGVRHARLLSDHDLRIREAYLVFGKYRDGIYFADGDFSTVPLGRTFKQEMIAGKPLEEQLQILFKLAVDNLNSEIASKEAEKKRLETALQK